MADIIRLNPRGVTRPHEVVNPELVEAGKREWRRKRKGFILAAIVSLVLWALIIAFGVWLWHQLSR